MADDVRAKVVLGGQVLESAGLSDMVWGHVSARDPEGRGVWMKASGQGFDEVSEGTVLLVDPQGEVLAGDGPRYSEYPIHTEILRARPDAQSVVHVHPFHAMALAASGAELQAFSHIGGVFSGGVRRYHDAAGLVTTAEEGAALAAALGDDRALLLGPPSLSSGRWRRKSRCGSTGARRRSASTRARRCWTCCASTSA